MTDLAKIRKEIDDVDSKLLEYFEYRMDLAHKVAQYKKKNGLPVFDSAREKEKLDSLKKLIKDKDNTDAVVELFSQIMAISRRAQYRQLNTFFDLGFIAVNEFRAGSDTNIAYYGEPGSYTQQAMLEYFNGKGIGRPMGTFYEVMEALKENKADYGVLPIENSSTGTLADIFDLLAEYDNYIIGEHVVAIDHCLWGLKEAELSDIKRVYSHRQGLLQCMNFLKQYPHLELVEGGSTASSARRVYSDNDISQAAIASRKAGETYGLKLLKASIHNEDHNQTRLIIISNKKEYYKKANQISICFALPHRSGALYNILSHFIHNNLNLTRIESRPIKGKAFRYRFFADFEGSLEDVGVKNALYSIGEEALELKILGSYVPVQ
jgi:chorismate mutase/prephenate dehydratase